MSGHAVRAGSVMKPIAVWLIGPPGSGKSTLIARSLPAGFRVVDQDAEMERSLLAKRFPLDIRSYDAEQSAAFVTLRREVADRVWAQVPDWRSEGIPIAFQTTGDKPHLLRSHVEAGKAAGYTNLGIGLTCPLETCLRRNGERPRVLPDSVVEKAWRVFQDNIDAGVYEEILGRDAFVIVADAGGFDLGAWLRRTAG